MNEKEGELPLVITNRYFLDTHEFQNFQFDYALRSLITKIVPQILKVCVGYFSPKAWEYIGEAFKSVPHLEMIIGHEYEIPADREKAIQEVYQSLLEGISIDEVYAYECIPDLINFLKRDSVQVRLLTSPFMHAKMYWTPGAAYVGSSNFSEGGFKKNTELNVLIESPQTLLQLQRWFDLNFKRAISYKEQLIDILDRSKFGNHPYTPFEVFLKIIWEQYKETFDLTPLGVDFNLAQFQLEGTNRAKRILKLFGGVLVADAVGLGKTYIALALLKDLSGQYHRALVICPAQLKDRWEKDIIAQDIPNVEVYSMELLGRKIPGTEYEKIKEYDFIVIDESHNFRNINRRYNNLQQMLQWGKHEKKIVLLTATPINTSIYDLYRQIKLITRGLETNPALKNIGITNLKDFFDELKSDLEGFELLRSALIVAHSRAEIRYRQEHLKIDLLLPDGTEIRFPERSLETALFTIIPDKIPNTLSFLEKKVKDIQKMISEGLRSEGTGFLERVEDVTPSNAFYIEVFKYLKNLQFPQFTLEEYKFKKYQDPDILNRSEFLRGMLRKNLLKRLESSLESFRDSIQVQKLLVEQFFSIFQQGYQISSSVIRSTIDDVSNREEEDDVDFLENVQSKILTKIDDADFRKTREFEKLFKSVEINEFPEDLSQLKSDIEGDIQKLGELLQRVEQVLSTGDLKLQDLKTYILQHCKGKKVLIFSYFKTTAKYLEKSLNSDRNWLHELGITKVELITGDTKAKERTSKVLRFAPHSNTEPGAPVPEINDPIQILISTDVLSEGQNLQDAQYVINYDLHWNPVRIIQREGRIDRLRSLHKKIHIYNFFPERGLDLFLNLMPRLTNRIDVIDETFALDGDIIYKGEARQFKEDLEKIQSGDLEVLNKYERKLELESFDPAKELLLSFLKDKARNYFDVEIPCGVHSGFLHPSRSGLAVVIGITRGGIRTLKWIFQEEDSLEDLRSGKYQVEPLIFNKGDVNRIDPFPESPRELFLRVAQITEKLKKQLLGEDVADLMQKILPRGNIKYHTLLTSLIGKRLIPQPEAQRFLDYLQQNAFSELLKDAQIKEFTQEFNIAWKKAEDLAKSNPQDASYQQVAWQEKKNAMEIFLNHIYAFMDTKRIHPFPIKKNTLESSNFQLIAFLRLFTPKSHKELLAQK